MTARCGADRPEARVPIGRFHVVAPCEGGPWPAIMARRRPASAADDIDRGWSDLLLDWYRNAGRLRSKLFSLGIGPSFGGFGDRAVIEPPLRVYGERRIIIGAAVHIGASSWLQVLGGEGPSAIEIGDGSSLGARCTISAVEHVSIGRSVLLASNVYVSDHSHDVADPSRPISRQGVTDVRPVAIGDGAWLGQNTVVTPGVRIGRGAVVGANSVVTRDVPDRCVAVGAPARVVRQLLEGEGW